MTERCEWDPVNDKPADDLRGCQREATLSVGAGMSNWHLCASCAALPRFNRYRRRVRLDASGKAG